MSTCFLIPLLWVLGAALIAGLIGWLLGKKKTDQIAHSLLNKEYELENIRTSMNKVLSKTNDDLAVIHREKNEFEDQANLWKDKFNKLQLSQTDPIDLAVLQEEVSTLKLALEDLKTERDKLKSANTTLVKSKSQRPTGKVNSKITNDLNLKLKKQYKKEINQLKKELKKSKSKLKKAKKALKAMPREIEITKSLDITTLKKLLDKAPLKKVSERIIKRS